jgi:hypothetical protein
MNKTFRLRGLGPTSEVLLEFGFRRNLIIGDDGPDSLSTKVKNF